jgi:site-specific DNA-cytosine methylase
LGEMTRTCFVCKVERSLDEFAESVLGAGGRAHSCIPCNSPKAGPSRERRGPSAPRAVSVPRERRGPLRPTRTLTERKSARPPVLVINTYAGSLLLACRALGVDVVGSYEDAGYGQEWQRRNFPELDGLFASERKTWPDARLEGTVVIAHPPCAAFSVQRGGAKGNAGVDSSHFACTVEVCEYAMGLGCEALAIESVQGALEGARHIHDAMATRYGYQVYRILQNAATFGVPQWRPRFWVIFVKDGYSPFLPLHHVPRAATVRETLEDEDPGDEDPRLRTNGQREYLLTEKDLDVETVDRIMATPGKLCSTIRRELELTDAVQNVSGEYCLRPSSAKKDGKWRMGVWISETLVVLEPDGFCPTILHNSWFSYKGRAVTPDEYKALMGFPREYVLDAKYRQWLSKGVCPPVAEWVLDQVLRKVEGAEVTSGAMIVPAGEVADLQIDKPAWRALAGVPEPEATERAPRVARGPSEPRPRAPRAERVAGAGRKRRVVATYRLTCQRTPEVFNVEAAFAGRDTVVCAPLRSAPEIEGENVRVELQYEPPNAGGHVGDVDRIAERGRKTLEAAGFGPVGMVRLTAKTIAPEGQ